jgi:hypothetical protein
VYCDDCADGRGTPAPAPTPDVAGESYCNAHGGDFLDITGAGGTGLSCAGGDGGAPNIIGQKCGLEFDMHGGGTSWVKLPDGTEFDVVSGLEINGDDCSYQISW